MKNFLKKSVVILAGALLVACLAGCEENTEITTFESNELESGQSVVASANLNSTKAGEESSTETTAETKAKAESLAGNYSAGDKSTLVITEENGKAKVTYTIYKGPSFNMSGDAGSTINCSGSDGNGHNLGAKITKNGGNIALTITSSNWEVIYVGEVINFHN